METQEQQPEPRGSELTENEFNSWRLNQSTQRFMAFLQDYASTVANAYTAQIMGGYLPDQEKAREHATLCVVVRDVINLDFEDIAKLYGLEKEQPQHEEETHG